jgi:hypothetical protein
VNNGGISKGSWVYGCVYDLLPQLWCAEW